MKKLGIAPEVIRIDKGIETIIAADVQYLYTRKIRGETYTFRDCFIYSMSTANERVEAQQGQISKVQLLDQLVS